MRRRTVAMIGVLMVVLSGREAADAQVYRYETPPPLVTAAGANWQVNGEPVFYAGNFYYPAGATVFFDGKVMVRSGVYRGVPLYTDVTLEPYSVVYVPVGGAVMRPYERRREGELAGTVGSRTPSFPIDRDVEISAATGLTGIVTPPVSGFEPRYLPDADYVWMRVPRSALSSGTTPGTAVSPAAPQQPPTAGTAQEPFTASGVVTIPPTAPGTTSASPTYGNTPSATQAPAPRAPESGVWVEFDGARWYSAGTAVPYDPSRFETAGDYHGFPVYRERGSAGDRIFVTVVHDGPIAPFARR